MNLEPTPLRRRRLPQLLALGLSAAALVGMVQLQNVWAHEAESDDALAMEEYRAEEVEAEAVEAAAETPAEAPTTLAATATPPAAAAATPESAAATPTAPVLLADASAVTETAAEAAAASIVPDAPALITMPNLKGMSLRKAKKTLKGLGLKMTVRDSYNERLPREYWSDYKVRRQKIEPGTKVEPGSKVRVKARLKRRLAMGY